jgi:hypothetical protein
VAGKIARPDCGVESVPKRFTLLRVCPKEEHIEIAVALQNHLPMVAQKICSYPNYKEHFITLGLGTPR